MFRNTSLAVRLYIMLVVAVVPLCAVVGFQVRTGLRDARELDSAFATYDLSTRASARYRTFLNGVADAVDSGHLGSSAVDALKEVGAIGERLKSLAGPQAVEIDRSIASLLASTAKSAELDALMPLQATIRATDQALVNLAARSQKDLNDVVARSAASASSRAVVVSLTAAASISVALLLGIVLIRNTTRRLKQASSLAGHIAAGRLDTPVDVGPADETGQLLRAMQSMQDALAGVLHEIRTTVSRAAQGDFTYRIDVSEKSGFGREIGEALNTFVHDLDGQIGGTPRYASEVALRIAAGDISQDVRTRDGDETSLLAAMAMMRSNLERVIAEIREVVNAAANGRFDRKMSPEQYEGYARTVAELLNRLTGTTEAGLREVLQIANAVAEGDLTKTANNTYPGLFGEALSGMNRTVTQLNELLRSVAEAGRTLDTAAREISTGNEALLSSADNQTRQIEVTSKSMHNLTDQVRATSGNAKAADGLATRAEAAGSKGADVVLASVTTMQEVQRSSKKVREITDLINGIAFQTNILALNAAVEAARAGEQGRGFAVVAQDVRSLALRTTAAAGEINALVLDSVGKVEQGAQQVQQAGSAMEEIMETIRRLRTMVADILGASDAQASDIDSVNAAVDSFEQANGRTVELAGIAANATSALEQQIEALGRMIARFRLHESAGEAPRQLRRAARS